jgi:hypothetical protein
MDLEKRVEFGLRDGGSPECNLTTENNGAARRLAPAGIYLYFAFKNTSGISRAVCFS